MPNHVINELIFNVGPEDQARVLAATLNADGKVDFGVLVPRPLNLWAGNVGTEHEKAFKRTALDWNRENWGTKWNAYDMRPVEADETKLILRFETAWGPPYPWLAAILNHLNLPFDHNWMSEGGWPPKHGEFRLADRFGEEGPEWSEAEADEALGRHLHKLLWGVERFPDEDDDSEAPTHNERSPHDR